MWATPITIDIFILNELVNASLFVASCQIWNEAEVKKNQILKFFSFFWRSVHGFPRFMVTDSQQILQNLFSPLILLLAQNIRNGFDKTNFQ